MSYDIALARESAWNLSRILMVPVVLICTDGQFGIMEASEYDGDEGAIVHEFDPYAR